MTNRRFRAVSLISTLAVVAFPAALGAQARRGPSSATGWAPVAAGVHGGYDYTTTSYLVGAQMRIPVHPSGYLQVIPNGDVVFQPRLKEYLAGANLVVVSGGRRGGLYAGGGLTWRNTLREGVRTTRRSPTIVVGAQSPTLFGAPFRTHVEVRWIREDTPLKPKLLTFGVNFPLWGRGAEDRR
ncbi:MAG TPA: hypothetical protein VLA36_00110 [Longimicrobiales bacterium]|nr:hypothetical protein [Longimicrobiales bacterium]